MVIILKKGIKNVAVFDIFLVDQSLNLDKQLNLHQIVKIFSFSIF